jgi:hypothetical protein
VLNSGRLCALPTNTKRGWKDLTGTNNLAYYGKPKIMAIISFMIQVPEHFGDFMHGFSLWQIDIMEVDHFS